MSETETALEIIPKESAFAVLTNAEKFDEFYERVAKEVRGVEPDLTTAAGRKAVAALAFKVTKSKTAIVAAADLLTEEWRANTAKVTASRKGIETRLDELKVEVRKPLTDWEADQEAKARAAASTMTWLRECAVIRADVSVADLQSILNEVTSTALDSAVLGDHFQIAMTLRDTAASALSAGIERAEKAEADAAELAALREQTAQREREDEERRQAERRSEEERQAEARRQQEERDRQERVRQEQEAERQRQEGAEEQRIAREKQVADEAAAAERKRIEDAAAAQRAADEKRAANVKHQGKIMGEARDAILTVIGETSGEMALASAIVNAIITHRVPHTAITF